MQVGTIQTVAQQHVAGLQMLHRFDIEHAAFVGGVGTERKPLQRTAAQIEQSHYLHHRKPATGFLPDRLGILLLIGRSVFQLHRGAVHDHDAPPSQQPSRRHHLLTDPPMHRIHTVLWQALARIAVTAGAVA